MICLFLFLVWFLSDVRTVWNSFIEVDYPFECVGRVGQGNNMGVAWNFNDGSSEVNMKVAGKFFDM